MLRVLNSPTSSVGFSNTTDLLHGCVTTQLLRVLCGATQLLREMCGGKDFFQNWFAGSAAVQCAVATGCDATRTGFQESDKLGKSFRFVLKNFPHGSSLGYSLQNQCLGTRLTVIGP